MRIKDKHLVYAEDVVWEIMQYPSSSISKRLVKQCVDTVIKKKSVNIFVHIWNLIKEAFTR